MRSGSDLRGHGYANDGGQLLRVSVVAWFGAKSEVGKSVSFLKITANKRQKQLVKTSSAAFERSAIGN
jgi:hypothetical protein